MQMNLIWEQRLEYPELKGMFLPGQNMTSQVFALVCSWDVPVSLRAGVSFEYFSLRCLWLEAICSSWAKRCVWSQEKLLRLGMSSLFQDLCKSGWNLFAPLQTALHTGPSLLSWWKTLIPSHSSQGNLVHLQWPHSLSPVSFSWALKIWLKVNTEMNMRVVESKECCLEEPDLPRVVPAAGCCSVSVVRLTMKDIDRYWRQRKSIVFGVSGVNNSERLFFMCSQNKNSLASRISKGTSNLNCECGAEHCTVLFPSLVNDGCSCAGLQALSSTASTWPPSTATSCHRGDARRSQRCPWALEPLLIISSTQQSPWRIGAEGVSVTVRGLSLWHWERAVRHVSMQLGVGRCISLSWGGSTGRDFGWNDAQSGSNICSGIMRRRLIFAVEKLKLLSLGSCRLLRKLEQNGCCSSV